MYVIATVFCSNFQFSISLHVPFSQSSFQIDPNSNAYLLAKVGFDTAENEPSKVGPPKASQPEHADWPAKAERRSRTGPGRSMNSAQRASGFAAHHLPTAAPTASLVVCFSLVNVDEELSKFDEMFRMFSLSYTSGDLLLFFHGWTTVCLDSWKIVKIPK